MSGILALISKNKKELQPSALSRSEFPKEQLDAPFRQVTLIG